MAQQTLVRSLNLRSLVVFGLAYMTPLIVIGTFGVIASVTSGASAGAYTLATVAMLFTAHSYARMAGVFPVSGSAYTYVRATMGVKPGFLVGWMTLLDYLFLPMVIWLIGGSYLQAQFPAIPLAVWIIIFIVFTTAVNVIGMRVADKVNVVLMTFQALVLVLFIVFSITAVTRDGGLSGIFSMAPFLGEAGEFTPVVAGAAVAAYAFLGFDAVTTMSEETIEPRKTVPKAIMLIALIGGGIFIIVSYAVQLVHPGGVFADVDTAGFEIATQIGGAAFAAVFIAALVIAQFTSGIAAQAAGSRLLYAMGRDRVMPRIFAKLAPKFATPVVAIIAIGVVGLIALAMDVATSTSFINFGAFISFAMVNVAVLVYWSQRRRAGEYLNPVAWVVAPLVGAIVVLTLLPQLDIYAITLGTSWLVIGVIILAVLTRGFRVDPPETVEELAEKAEV